VALSPEAKTVVSLNAKQQKQQILKVDITSVRRVRRHSTNIVFFRSAGKFLLFRPNNLILHSITLFLIFFTV